MDRWLWICPIVGIAGAAVMLWVFGLSWLSALGIAFLISCPAITLWTLREARSSFGERDRLVQQLTEARRNHG